MKSKPLPSVERLNELFIYEDGKLIAKPGKGVRKKSLLEAGHTDKRGYCEIRIDYKLYLRHRLIWKMLKGYDPEVIDHINGVPGDDRIENLQDTTQRHNGQKSVNFTKRKHSLPLGVHHSGKRYYACAHLNGKSTRLGTYDTPEEASIAYQLAVGNHCGAF